MEAENSFTNHPIMKSLLHFLRERPQAPAALAKFILHAAVMHRYGFFIDEYYYIACSEHLAAGYVDHPPLSIFLLAGVRAFLGDSIYAIRLPAALAGAGLVYLCGSLAGRMGGGFYARAIASLAGLIAPFYLGINNFYSMNSLDLLVWAAAFYVLMNCLEKERTGDWIFLGLLLGAGLLNKLSVVFLGIGLAGGLLLSPARRLILTRGPWLAAGIALILFSPHLIWQFQTGWTTLEFMRNAALLKNNPLTLFEFIKAQVISMHPLLFPLWLGGLYYLLMHREARNHRVLGWVFVINFIIYVSMNGKAYYLAPAFCVLLAGGARLLERRLNSLERSERFERSEHGVRPAPMARFARPLVFVLLIAGGAATAPLASPILPVEKYIAYSEALGLRPPRMEKQATGRLPQNFADMFGYPEITETVLSVARSLPPEERAHAAIFASNYGLAGSLRFLGRGRGMPPVYSGHNNFHLWGPGKGDFTTVIAIGISRSRLEEVFGRVEEKKRTRCTYCMPDRHNLPIYLCRDRKVPVKELWKRVKEFI